MALSSNLVIVPRRRLVAHALRRAVAAAAICAVVVGGSGPWIRASAEDQIVSVDDVIAGIEARSSAIKDVTARYTVVHELTEFFYEHHAWHREQQLRAGVPEDSLPAVDRASSPARRVSEYILSTSGDRAAYQVLDPDDPEHVVRQGAFDGEVRRAVNRDDLRGTIAYSSPADAVPFTRVGELLRVDNAETVDFLRDATVEASITDVSLREGSVVAVISARRRNPPPTNVPAGVRIPRLESEYLIEIDTTHDFWPLLIQHTSILLDEATGQSVRRPQNETRVSGFHGVGSFSYPRQIVSSEFGDMWEYRPGSVLPEYTRVDRTTVTTAIVREVTINSNLSDADFGLIFPAGTSYQDQRDGRVYLVNPDGTLKDLIADMKEPFLPASQYTKEEAAKLIGPPSDMRYAVRPTASTGRRFLLYANVGALAMVAAYLAVRRYRRRRRERGNSSS